MRLLDIGKDPRSSVTAGPWCISRSLDVDTRPAVARVCVPLDFIGTIHTRYTHHNRHLPGAHKHTQPMVGKEHHRTTRDCESLFPNFATAPCLGSTAVFPSGPVATQTRKGQEGKNQTKQNTTKLKDFLDCAFAKRRDGLLMAR